MAGNCITSTEFIPSLYSGHALRKEGLKGSQGEYRPLNPVSTPLYRIVEDYWEIVPLIKGG